MEHDDEKIVSQGDGEATWGNNSASEKNDLSASDNTERQLLKTTKDGIPLVPQPSDDPSDPLNWSSWRKLVALIVLSLESMLVKFSGTLIAPGALTIAAEFGVPASEATWIGTAQSVIYALAPLFWIPLSQRIGRRPVLLIAQLIAMAGGIGVANSQSYAQALGCRMVMGLGGSAGLCITPAAISDLFFLHQKGTRMGINAIFLVTGPWIGGVAGGSIQQNPHLGWRWSMYISAICYATEFCLQLFLVPETIYEREAAAIESPEKKNTLSRRLLFRTPTNAVGETLAQTFRRPYAMFVYPAVLLPSFWVSVCVMSEIANTAGFALNFGVTTHFQFDPRQVGFCYFSGLIGACLGEVTAGPLCDFVAKRALRKGETWRPEKLLPLTITGGITIVAGLLLYGLELQYGNNWAPPLVGMGLFVFGQEIIVTVVMTYMTECYPGRAGEVAIVFQFFFNLMTFHPPFYTPAWIAMEGGAKIPYIIYAILPICLFPFCIGMFIWKGQSIRAKGEMLNLKKKK